MGAFDTIGFFVVVLMAALGFAAVSVSAGFGAWVLWMTWKRGSEGVVPVLVRGKDERVEELPFPVENYLGNQRNWGEVFPEQDMLNRQKDVLNKLRDAVASRGPNEDPAA